MSLDIDLWITEPIYDDRPDQAIPVVYVRENGRNMRLTPEEYKEQYPDAGEPVVMMEPPICDGDHKCVFSINITHNLNTMAGHAGIYECMWRPDEHGMMFARDVITPLTIGLSKLIRNPEEYKQYNPANGWGDYEGLVQTAKSYLEACAQYPDVEIGIRR